MESRNRLYFCSFMIIGLLLHFMFLLPSIYAKNESENKKHIAIAVLQFTANNIPESTARIVRNNIEFSLFKMNKFDIIESNQIDIILKERSKKIEICHDEKCAQNIGNILKADYVIIGNVDKIENYVITIKVISVSERRLIVADTFKLKDINQIKKTTDEISIQVTKKIERLLKNTKEIQVALTARFNYCLPVSYLGGRSQNGYAASLLGRADNLIPLNLFCGFELGYFYFKGSNHMIRLTMIPFMINSGYVFQVWKFNIIPVISAGISYNSNYFYNNIYHIQTTTKHLVQPIIKGGGIIEFHLYESLHVTTGIEYVNVFEQSGNLSFFIFNGGMVFVF